MSPAPTSVPPIAFSQRREFAAGQAISFLMQQAVEHPQVISLAAGLVDEGSLPQDSVRTAIDRLLSDPFSARSALQYGATQGRSDLRDALLDYLAAQEGQPRSSLGIDASRVFVTTGSQQFLSLACEVLLDPGDICLVAAPTYFVFLGNLRGVGAEAVPVAVDDDGMRPDGLQQALEQLAAAGRLPRVKLIYAVSYYDNPSAVSVSAERRRQILEIARSWSQRQRILILEDAAYRELRYDGPALPSLWGQDASRSQVIYTQTFSKSLSPGLRVGFGVVPEELTAPLFDRKGNEDFGSANFNQSVVCELLRSGELARHTERVRAAYRQKRDAMVAAATLHFGGIPGVQWRAPHGGLYLWMQLPESIDTGFEGRLFRSAVNRHSVMYVPGDLFFAGPSAARPRNFMRLSFGVQSPEGIAEGMSRLSAAVREKLEPRTKR